ncbi:hypothetical protein ATN83_3470 [Raoultella ornithinolytica]|nr:hypothetical protein ATN83_3470 [Raoultella ornithinolytica]
MPFLLKMQTQSHLSFRAKDNNYYLTQTNKNNYFYKQENIS